jgi:hypothetical protein
MDVATFPRRRASSRPTIGQAITAAAKTLHDAGDPITYRRLARLAGCSTDTARNTANALKRAGGFPYVVQPWGEDKADPRASRKVIEAAAAIVEAGRELTYAALGEAMGCHPETAKSRVAMARELGKFPHEIVPRKPSKTPAQSVRDMAATSTVFSRHHAPVGPDPAVIAAIKAEHFAGMIDGRMERDDTPPGIPPMSFRNHAEWSRRKFERESSVGYERAIHRVASSGRRAES